ncbi:MAG: hypothetical protein WA869_09625 [Alloacidobacterium sp.]|jgi:hypothetical protein
MKGLQNAWIFTVATALAACSIPVLAQDAPSSAPAENAPTKNIQMVGAHAWLTKTIDAKKAKQGDAVTAKLVDNVKIPDAVELPKNTVLLGRIDEVQASENKGDSSVQVTFDKAQLKSGQQVAIKATIMQIVPAPNAMRNQESGAADSAPMSSSPKPGGTSGGMQSSAPSSPHPVPSGTSSTTDGSQESGSQSVSGIQVQSDIHQANSGVFTAKKKNVHVDAGTELQIAITVIPPNTQVN